MRNLEFNGPNDLYNRTIKIAESGRKFQNIAKPSSDSDLAPES